MTNLRRLQKEVKGFNIEELVGINKFSYVAGGSFVSANNIGEITNKAAAFSSFKLFDTKEGIRYLKRLVPFVGVNLVAGKGYESVVEKQVVNHNGRLVEVYLVDANSLPKFKAALERVDVSVLDRVQLGAIADDFDKIGRFLQETSIDVFKKAYSADINVGFIQSANIWSKVFKGLETNVSTFIEDNVDFTVSLTSDLSKSIPDRAGVIINEVLKLYVENVNDVVKNVLPSETINVCSEIVIDRKSEEVMTLAKYCVKLYKVINKVNRSLKADGLSNLCNHIRNAIITKGAMLGISQEEAIKIALCAAYLTETGNVKERGGNIFAVQSVFPREYVLAYLGKSKVDTALTIVEADVQSLSDDIILSFDNGIATIEEDGIEVGYVAVDERYTGDAKFEIIDGQTYLLPTYQCVYTILNVLDMDSESFILDNDINVEDLFENQLESFDIKDEEASLNYFVVVACPDKDKLLDLLQKHDNENF